MTSASGTRRGSAESTPSTSVQMWIVSASSSAPKIEAEKSLPLRPRVVCTPRGSLAMKPVMINVPSNPRSMAEAMRSFDASHCTIGPSAPHSTTTTSRASSQRTSPLRAVRCEKNSRNKRVDQISPYPETTSRMFREAERVKRTALRMPSMSEESRSKSASQDAAASGESSWRAMTAWRSRNGARPATTSGS